MAHKILTGPVNSGKSISLFEFVQKEIQKGTKISGWLSLPYFEEGKKQGYDLIFIIMSQILPKQPFIRPIPLTQQYTQWRKFYFNEELFIKAQSINFKTPDLFVIDEVGPLELFDHKGFWPLLKHIYSQHKNTLTVVRESLVEDFKNFSHLS